VHSSTILRLFLAALLVAAQRRTRLRNDGGRRMDGRIDQRRAVTRSAPSGFMSSRTRLPSAM
jgi:hypothetical protein